MLRRFLSLLPVVLIFAAMARGQAAPAPAAAPTLAIDQLGRGAEAIGGEWQFHLGDNPAWAQPGIDDATGQNGWEQIVVDKPWGVQGHFGYTGFAWYRRHLTVAPAQGVKADFRLFLPLVDGACEIYWNGRIIGRIGKLPPDPSWPAALGTGSFALPGAGAGVLAIRVWKAPLASSDAGNGGGLVGEPLVGSPEAIAGHKAIREAAMFRANLYSDVLNLIRLLIACAALIAWLRQRRETVYLWFAIFAANPSIWALLFRPGTMFPYEIASGIMQPLFALFNIALWYLLIHLLELGVRRKLTAWINWIAIVYLAVNAMDGVLVLFQAQWAAHPGFPIADAALTGFGIVGDIIPLVLVAVGVRKKLNPARWAVALTAFVSNMLIVLIAAGQQGQRFTHRTLNFLDPAFGFHGVYIDAEHLVDTALILSILYAVYRDSRERAARQRDLEEEMRSAQELQRVLIPEEPPAVPGFTLTSAYRPAREVGGDFFQIMPQAGGSTLIVLGDMSGKGLRAAMAVSWIVGAARALAEDYPGPAELLTQLNRRLCGRLQGGFATCVAVRLDAEGVCRVASAGHPAPYVNDREVALPGALPLGIDAATEYEEIPVRLGVGDHLALYSDGLLEARSAAGELFSFAGLENLFASGPDAARASEAAVEFGQEDDVTVLTLERLEAHEAARVVHRTVSI